MLPKINGLFRLAKETDLRFSAQGMAVCKLYLVASEKYKDKETQLWIGATAFGKTAEFIATIQKGQRVYVSAKLQTDEWNDAQGQKQSRITMLIDSFEYVEKKDASGAQNDNHAPQSNQQQPQQAYQPAKQSRPAPPPNQPQGVLVSHKEFDDDDLSDVPF